MHPHHLLYEPLLTEGIRFLRQLLNSMRPVLWFRLSFPDYVGAQDANCAWPGIVSFVRSVFVVFNATHLLITVAAQAPPDAVARSISYCL